jgi:hypothetical protein
MEEREILLELARRHRNWLKRKALVVSLARAGVIGGGGARCPQRVWGSEAGAEAFRAVHRHIASFL